MVDTTDALIEVSKRMNRIEEKDCDFRHNAKWIELKAQQDSLFLELAKEKLLCLKWKDERTMTEVDKKLLEFYKQFIKKGEERKNEN